MLGLAAHLPDTAVGFSPLVYGPVHQREEKAPVVVVGGVAPLVPAPGEVEQIAVHVELGLVRGAVSDADRA